MQQNLLLPIVLIFLSYSCTKGQEQTKGEQHGTPANWKFTLPQGDPANGKKLFVELECYKCHEVRGETFPVVAEKEKDVGRELSQMAGMHPIEFFAESIINPNAVIDQDAKEKDFVGQDGKSKMPDYSDVLTVKQVSDLAAYLASLKGEGHKGH